MKKLHEPIKVHQTRSLPTESKTVSKNNAPKETGLASLRASAAQTDVIRIVFFLILVRSCTCNSIFVNFHFQSKAKTET